MANYLFLIGIDKYRHQKELKSSVNDINSFRNLLYEKFDFAEENSYIICNEQATSKNIQDAFRKYIQILKLDDNLIIFYSGHGDYDKDSDIGYWVPFEAKDYSSSISNQTIFKYLENIKCTHIFIISDSCFSNSILLTNRTKNSNEYFEKKSRWALTSAFNIAMDSDEISNTLFCENILDYLEESENDFRVSELIEHVKNKFETNLFQKPQGAPLAILGHEGGEFVFKIKSQIDHRKFRGYNEFHKILTFYKRNSTFNEIVTYEDRTIKNGYVLFQEVDSVIKKSTYYLYLYEGINQTQTLKHLKETQSIIFKDKNLIVFITAEKGQKNREIRKKNLSDKFKPLNIFYIDEFIKKHCTPNIISDDESKYLNISNFISPPFKNDKGETDIQKLFHDWYEKTEEPILVIKGSGGIGKTTIAQFLADSLITNYPEHYVLFIDSVQVKDSLLKNKNRDKLSLYNFYEALYEITDNANEKLSEELFRINLDVGNILIIIDGLDEVITKIPNFNVNDFINSIKSSTTDLGNGKVILTCRTYFWDKADFSSEVFKIIELEAFNEVQAREFFNKSFNTNSKKTTKAIKLADDFRYPTTEKENIYHPYVLDIIRSIIDNESDEVSIERTDLSSKYLNSNLKNDYILFRVCEREKLRVGQIDVDKQIEFFIRFSVHKRGIIRLSDFKSEIEEAINEKVDLTNVEAFKSHQFLKISDTSIIFRYDFLADLFKGIYMSSFLKYGEEKIELSKNFIEILNESCWFGSALNMEIVNRLGSLSDDDLLLISDLISQINSLTDFNQEIKRKSIANLFNLCLTINGKLKGYNISSNTELLKNLFEVGKNKIVNLNIFNVNSDLNTKFDFSDLQIDNAIIDNFNNFWHCNFNENTKFKNCILLNIRTKTILTSINKNNFIDCTFDSDIESSLKLSESIIENRTEAIKTFLIQFFHLFISNGKLGRQWEHKVIEPRFNGINKLNINYNRLIKLLKKQNVLIVTQEKGKFKFAISEEHKENVVKFIKDGTVSKDIIELIEELKKI